MDRRSEIDDKGEHVQGEDEGDDPFEYGGYVGVVRVRGGCEDDGEEELDEDEGEFDPEGGAEDAMLAIFWAC